ncbi:hypothetical protein CHS0354_001718 [Potamilus streckersoni]|uniref:Leucine-rich repeat-containing protein 14 n=1 Tax=Potamilus streckersoni TaxID=2493646 RepID=A0AAE0VNH1_9BIVA|nr:hypothetical protein CHS0354_001718 [Potamilus streckersoni]
MFKALDKVNYDHVVLNEKHEVRNPQLKPKSLVNFSCQVINNYHELVSEAMHVLPVHLSQTLLQNAILCTHREAVNEIIANWPLQTLCFREILPKEDWDVFEEEMGCDFSIFQGVIQRTRTCRLKCLDFRGLKLNATFYKLIVQIWPLLSLKRYQLHPKKLAKIVAKSTGIEATRLTDEILPKILEERLDHEMLRNGHTRIFFQRGHRMEVKIDSIHFTTNNTFFVDFLICNGLRDLTPIYITVTNIYIRSELLVGDEILDSLAPFIVLKGQKIEGLEGISLHQLEEGIFFLIAQDIKKYTSIRSLDLSDCNIYLQMGKTRNRTSSRVKFMSTLSSLENLVRLDLSFNYLLGCLGELLDSLHRPLEFLSIRGCDLNEADLTALAKSKHGTSLRELNLSKLCQFSIYDSDKISPAFLLKITAYFPNLTLLNLSQNHLPDAYIPEFCDILVKKLTGLKGLDIAGNIMTDQSQIEVTRACARISSMQWLRMTCFNNLGEDGLLMLRDADNKQRFLDLLKSLGRSDIYVEVVRLSFAIFLDLIDVFH